MGHAGMSVKMCLVIENSKCSHPQQKFEENVLSYKSWHLSYNLWKQPKNLSASVFSKIFVFHKAMQLRI